MHELLSLYRPSFIHAYYCGVWQHKQSSPSDGPGLILGCLDQQSEVHGDVMWYSGSCVGLKDGVHPLLFGMQIVRDVKESSAKCVQDIVVNLFPTRIATFSRAVAAQKSQLLPYLIAVRMAPVLPSWFVNLAAPILQVWSSSALKVLAWSSDVVCT